MSNLCWRANILSRSLPNCDRQLSLIVRRRITTKSAVTQSPISLSSRPRCQSPGAKSRLAWRDWFSSSQIRAIHYSPVTRHGGIERPASGTGIKVHFKDSKGSLIKTVEASEGDDLLAIAHEYDIDLEGACEGSVACSTCHVILTPEYYDQLPEPDDDENDMLDMAFGLTDTSRLGCQVKLTKDLDGITATLPSATRNMFVDGKKPTKH
ncbi:ferredoxin [Macrolepiota fuliginosa MF-IS2]|uniref:Ferredoxin n=1 Tax=Macrolepiota fuliginosa MF-IS2 TaxID=1400762 RepID=A0A9P5X9P3_9AGAR|nr:ferredoxin [Macrolepiota fuliginosa MF-IS2]